VNSTIVPDQTTDLQVPRGAQCHVRSARNQPPGAEDGTPMLLADSHESATAIANSREIETVSLH
jgi:hypothetical protein